MVQLKSLINVQVSIVVLEREQLNAKEEEQDRQQKLHARQVDQMR